MHRDGCGAMMERTVAEARVVCAPPNRSYLSAAVRDGSQSNGDIRCYNKSARAVVNRVPVYEYSVCVQSKNIFAANNFLYTHHA